MAVVVSGNITQAADGSPLTFSDSSTGVGTLVSRVLVITDSNSVVLATINMGSTLTATHDITADIYATFTETIIDNTGTYVLVINYASVQFYNLAQAALAAQLAIPCNCDGASCTSLVKARESINAALTFTAIGDGQSAQIMLNNADYYINNPVYA